MKINGNTNNFYANIGTQRRQAQPVFQRQLRPDELEDYQKNTIEPALKYLGVENLAMILHGSCYPVEEMDLGVGSPNGRAAQKMIEFEKLHGFNSNQLGPMGEVTKGDISPNSASVFALNRLFIDVNELAKDEYANILPKGMVEDYEILYFNEGTPVAYSKFFDAYESNEKIIKKAYFNLREKVRSKEPKALKLKDEYEEFKKNKGPMAVKAALFEVLSKTYGTRDVDKWENETDRNLIQLVESGDEEGMSRYKQLLVREKDEIHTYIFAQFLEYKQLKENKKFRDRIGFEYINDNLIGNDKSEEWMYKDIFVKNYRIGCPDGGQNNGPQLLDIPLLNPKKLFNPDGSLGPAGKFLRDKIESQLEYCENIRIDHAIGLVDPFIYDKNSVVKTADGYDLSKFRGGNISRMKDVDPHEDYKRILRFIVLPLLEKHNIPIEKVVWDNLGNQTDTFRNIYSNELHIPGITQLHWSRGEGAPRSNWLLMGSYDEPSAISYVKDINVRNRFDSDNSAWHVDYLSGFLNPDPARTREKLRMKDKLLRDPQERVKAKFAELFLTGKQVQIPFSDFFGIEERYNLKGQKSAANWKLRLSKDYRKAYYKNLSSEHPTAINMPEVLKMAVQAKADHDVVNYSKTYAQLPDGSCDQQQIKQYRKYVNERLAPLMEKLTHYEKVLKEKEKPRDSSVVFDA